VHADVSETHAASIFRAEDVGSAFLKRNNNKLKNFVYSGAVRLQQNLSLFEVTKSDVLLIPSEIDPIPFHTWTSARKLDLVDHI
jgi:hypothetical protein